MTLIQRHKNAYCSCSGAVRHRQNRRTAYGHIGKAPRTLADKQPHAHQVCRLMVSTPVITTWITTRLPTQKG